MRLGDDWTGARRGGKNKICCDTSKDKEKWSQCEWSDCSASCPSSKVRVALDTTECKNGGRARCCTPSYFDTIKVENPKLDEYRDEIRRYLDNPTCSKPGSIDARSLSAFSSIDARGLSKRQSSSTPGQHKTTEMCIQLLILAGPSSMIEEVGRIWDNYIGAKWPNLRVSHMRREVKKLYDYQAHGPIQVCHDITCSPHSWDNRLGSSPVLDCSASICQMEPVSDDGEYCDEVDTFPPSSASVLRVHGINGTHADPAQREAVRSLLSKRTSERDWSGRVTSPDGSDYVVIATRLPEVSVDM